MRLENSVYPGRSERDPKALCLGEFLLVRVEGQETVGTPGEGVGNMQYVKRPVPFFRRIRA